MIQFSLDSIVCCTAEKNQILLIKKRVIFFALTQCQIRNVIEINVNIFHLLRRFRFVCAIFKIMNSIHSRIMYVLERSLISISFAKCNHSVEKKRIEIFCLGSVRNKTRKQVEYCLRRKIMKRGLYIK